MKPLAITCGDPSGIGPEVIAAWLAAHPEEAPHVAVLGPALWLDTLPAGITQLPLGLEDYVAKPGQPDGASSPGPPWSGRRKAAARGNSPAW